MRYGSCGKCHQSADLPIFSYSLNEWVCNDCAVTIEKFDADYFIRKYSSISRWRFTTKAYTEYGGLRKSVLGFLGVRTTRSAMHIPEAAHLYQLAHKWRERTKKATSIRDIAMGWEPEFNLGHPKDNILAFLSWCKSQGF